MSALHPVLLCNSTAQLMSRIPVYRAISLIASDRAYMVERAAHGRVFHSAGGLEIPVPSIVMLTTYVHTPFIPHANVRLTKTRIHERDDYTCAYCLGHGDTLDHIIPRSKGGLNTWDNLITACEKCNMLKADRTPTEAGMSLRFEPWIPDPDKRTQERVYEAYEKLFAAETVSA